MGDKPSDATFKSGIRWLVGSAVLTCISLGGWAAYGLFANRSSEPPSVRVVAIERGMVETTINESGTVELGSQQTLTSPVEGAVEQVLVQPGDRIQQGEVLIVLRNPERQTALSAQQVKIDQQRVSLERSRQQIAEAQEQLETDREFLQRLASLAQAGAVAQKDVREQEDRMRSTLANLRTAQAEAQKTQLELNNLQLERQRIQQELDNTVITAPISGIVLGVDVQDGDGVERRTQLLTIGNPSEQLVQLQLSTLNAAQVRVNQVARVSVIGPNAENFAGRVNSLYPQAVTSNDDSSEGRSTQDSGQPKVPTTVRLNAPTPALIPGSQVNVEIVLQQRPNVVTLAIDSIQQPEADPFVWVLDAENRVQKRSITIGLEGLVTVEITSGLRPGDRVIQPSPDLSLEPGMLVTPEGT